jgi:HEPN domain-containing protein
MRTRHVGEDEIPQYFSKALRFSRSMHAAFSEGNWDAVGLSAVHMAISLNDALTGLRAGVRSAGPKHDDAVDLFRRNFTEGKSQGAAEDLRWLIGKKSLVEYESRALTEKEAEESVERADRFLEFAKRKLPDQYQE